MFIKRPLLLVQSVRAGIQVDYADRGRQRQTEAGTGRHRQREADNSYLIRGTVGTLHAERLACMLTCMHPC